MAGASLGMPSGAGGVLWNPATTAFLTSPEAAAGYRGVVLDIGAAFASYAIPTAGRGVWSVNVLDLSSGSVQDIQEGPDGGPFSTGVTWSANSFVGGVSWARAFVDNVAVGATLKGFYDRIGSDHTDHYTAAGFLADLGVQYRSRDAGLCAGASIRNAGFLATSYTPGFADLPLPWSVGAGISYVLPQVRTLRVAADVQKINGQTLRLVPAVELTLLERVLWLRCGYGFSSSDAREGIKVLAGSARQDYVKSSWDAFCAGAGFSSAEYGVNLSCDVALEFREIAPALAVSVSYSY